MLSSEIFTAEIVKTESLTTIMKFEAEPATVMNVGAAAGSNSTTMLSQLPNESVSLSSGVINDQKLPETPNK